MQTSSELSDLIDIETATEATVPTIDLSRLGPSVDLIVRRHFNPSVVHDRDLELFARAAALVDADAAVFLDIGAAMGNTIASLIALQCRFTVHAFEINPAFHAHLRRAAAMYRGAGVVVHPHGLGSEPGRAWLHIPVMKELCVLGEAALSLSYIQRDDRKAQLRSYCPGETLRVGKVQVEARTLDSTQLSPDFVKLDVEGSEPSVLAGARDTLGRCRPIIMAENSFPQAVAATLAPFGYVPYYFDPARGRLETTYRPVQNTFYLEETWTRRLRGAGLLA